ncbi:TetR/AcrR family transcriptional regulator C-terminal domain-containing protein [Antrihabitans cavernicola]|uniref:TetR family transcriptional regulator n=1 Tax=Antrihabitans cavernicola TaxID=2495913 RepID=A0A5A7SCM0_9NOCA|nr:TetR/AcrR family transcriptional regulator C-terminal domain-containing protein [Spelaeibacter cavernicola]KAA0023900.1 TetR family transcriptional regulator [Spelaeibacter cavernicola]
MAIDRERVVRTALQLLNEVGLERLTLRRIATELDVQAPALYWHFKNKKELLDAMATTVLADSAENPLEWEGMDWREFATTYGVGLRAALLRYRDGAKMVPGTYLTDDAMYRSMEASLQVLLDAGFGADDASLALSTIYSYTVGFAIEEQAVYPRPGERDDRYDPARRRDRIDRELTPIVAELAAQQHPPAEDHQFRRGLNVILAGLATMLPS